MLNTNYVENMSLDQIERFQKRMYAVSDEYGCHGCSSVTGFLAKNEKLLDVVKNDLETFNYHHADIDVLAEKLFELMNTAIVEMNKIRKMEVLIEGRYLVKITTWMGFQYCPFSDVKENYKISPWGHIYTHCGRSNMDVTITDIKTKKKINFCSLLVHLIKDHHFCEGSVEHRLDPVTLINFFGNIDHITEKINNV